MAIPLLCQENNQDQEQKILREGTLGSLCKAELDELIHNGVGCLGVSSSVLGEDKERLVASLLLRRRF